MLSVQAISKAFGKEPVLKAVNLALAPEEVLSVLGKSGSGKTTLLKIIAGLEQADEGDIKVNQQSILSVPAHLRNIVYLYQEPLLFPHLTVAQNVGFGLGIRNIPQTEIKVKVADMLEALELQDQGSKRPHQLSGGQKQRVAFGRALIINPSILLLDEPFGALDVETRQHMQALFQRVKQQYQMTAIFVTHDLKEAMIMGDRIGFMREGQLDLYDSLQAFVQDPRTEAQREMKFWEGIINQASK